MEPSTELYLNSTADSTTLMAGMFAFLGIFIVVALIGYVITSLLMGMIFKKAGEEPWKAWVPVYNSWVFLELGGQKGWLALLLLASIIPYVGWLVALVPVIFMCIAAYRIGLNLQKEGWFVILYIFFTLVWLIWLAFDKSTWKGNVATETQAPQGVPAFTPASNQAPATFTPEAPVGSDTTTPLTAQGPTVAPSPDLQAQSYPAEQPQTTPTTGGFTQTPETPPEAPQNTPPANPIT